MGPPLSFRRWSRRAGLACAALLSAWYLISAPDIACHLRTEWNTVAFPLRNPKRNMPMNASLKTREWRKRIAPAVRLIAALFSVWYLIFEWNSFSWPPWEHGPCYSSNHMYYVTQHQTLWEKLWRTYPDEYGTARLYDRSGKLLYEGKTQTGDAGLGPRWFQERVSMGEDNSGKLWEARLPVPPGDERMRRTCYP